MIWCNFCAQIQARVLFPGIPRQHQHSKPPALESSQSGPSHSLSPAVGPLHPTSFQGLSALITCCRPSTPLVQQSMTAHSNLPLEEGDGAVSSVRATTPCSQDLFASLLATTSSAAENDDDPIVDSAGMLLETV